jgi:hypothetical protein
MENEIVLASCRYEDLPIPFGIGTMSRITLTKMVVAIDIIIMICYTIMSIILIRRTSIEANNIGEDIKLLPDFTVEIKNLPDKELYSNGKNLFLKL